MSLVLTDDCGIIPRGIVYASGMYNINDTDSLSMRTVSVREVINLLGKGIQFNNVVYRDVVTFNAFPLFWNSDIINFGKRDACLVYDRGGDFIHVYTGGMAFCIDNSNRGVTGFKINGDCGFRLSINHVNGVMITHYFFFRYSNMKRELKDEYTGELCYEGVPCSKSSFIRMLSMV